MRKPSNKPLASTQPKFVDACELDLTDAKLRNNGLSKCCLDCAERMGLATKVGLSNAGNCGLLIVTSTGS